VSDGLFNVHQVMEAAQCKPVVWISFAPDYTTQSGGFDKKKGWNDWAEVVAATGIDEWATITNRDVAGQAWFPASFADAVRALRFRDSGPVKVATGIPCAALKRGDQWKSSRCGKPATGRGPAQFRSNDSPLCNLHLSVARKVKANDEARRAEWAAREQAWEQERSLTAASADWAARLRDEFQIPAAGTRCRDDELRVAVHPERLYAMLAEVEGALRDAGLSWSEVTTPD